MKKILGGGLVALAAASAFARERHAIDRAHLRAYGDGQRSGGDTIMAAALYGVSDADIKALAHYLSRSNARVPAR